MNTDRQPQQPPTRDDYGQIAPESARPATLTPEQHVKAPGQDGDLLLTRGTVVEAEWPHGPIPGRSGPTRPCGRRESRKCSRNRGCNS